jgi:cell shape-determining protein MreC
LDGIIIWKGESNEMGFYGVLKHFDVKIGDVVLTSEYSDYFLPNIPVGVVYKINNEVPGLFKDIRLKTFTEFHTLEDVFILTDTTHSVALNRGFEQSFIQREQH